MIADQALKMFKEMDDLNFQAFMMKFSDTDGNSFQAVDLRAGVKQIKVKYSMLIGEPIVEQLLDDYFKSLEYRYAAIDKILQANLTVDELRVRREKNAKGCDGHDDNSG